MFFPQIHSSKYVYDKLPLPCMHAAIVRENLWEFFEVGLASSEACFNKQFLLQQLAALFFGLTFENYLRCPCNHIADFAPSRSLPCFAQCRTSAVSNVYVG